jgi:hypothetical protein
MDTPVVALPTLDSLRGFVREALCTRDHLDPQASVLKQAEIRRGERRCGLFFQVLGQNRQRAFAVWAGDEHRILFYDATGTRFQEVRLSEAPDPQLALRTAA